MTEQHDLKKAFTSVRLPFIAVLLAGSGIWETVMACILQVYPIGMHLICLPLAIGMLLAFIYGKKNDTKKALDLLILCVKIASLTALLSALLASIDLLPEILPSFLVRPSFYIILYRLLMAYPIWTSLMYFFILWQAVLPFLRSPADAKRKKHVCALLYTVCLMYALILIVIWLPRSFLPLSVPVLPLTVAVYLCAKWIRKEFH